MYYEVNDVMVVSLNASDVVRRTDGAVIVGADAGIVHLRTHTAIFDEVVATMNIQQAQQVGYLLIEAAIEAGELQALELGRYVIV